MESWRLHVILLQIMLLLVLLALPAVADCDWSGLREDTHHYEGNYTSRAYKDTFKDGDTAPYKCQSGYAVSGLYSGPHVLNATCRGDKWVYDPRNLVCKAISCGHPCPGGSCRNGDVSPPVFNFPGGVKFTCKQGYHLVAHDDHYWDPKNTVYCKSDGKWSRPAPKCVEVRCPQPPPIGNGQVSPQQPIFRENDVVQYTCNQPYTLVGDATRRCQNNVTWSGNEPTCEIPGATTCPRPGSIVNGVVDVPSGTLGVNARIRYRCDTGYTLVGVGERVCQSDGSWSDSEPVCQVAVVTTCPTPGSITNGVVDVPPGLLGVNTKVQYRCNAGYMLIGMTERVCQMDGSWSGVEPRCQAIPGATCPAPGPIANGAVDFPPGMLGVNTRVQYRCNPGYTLVGMMERVCQADGSWSNAEPVCQASGHAPQPPQPPATPTTSQSPVPDAHPPAGDDKASDSSSNSEAQTTSWVLLSLLGVLVVAGAVVLYMAFQFYLSKLGGDEDAMALMPVQGLETKSGVLP